MGGKGTERYTDCRWGVDGERPSRTHPFLFFCVYFERETERETETARKSRGRAERKGERESDVGLELANSEILIWAEIKSQKPNPLSRPGSPHTLSLFFKQIGRSLREEAAAANSEGHSGPRGRQGRRQPSEGGPTRARGLRAGRGLPASLAEILGMGRSPTGVKAPAALPPRPQAGAHRNH